MKDGHPLLSHVEMRQTTSYSKPYVLMSRNLIGKVWPKRNLEMLLLFRADIKGGLAVNSLLGIFQTTSSNSYILLSRNLMGGIMDPKVKVKGQILNFLVNAFPPKPFDVVTSNSVGA